jgi:hypothetical protein
MVSHQITANCTAAEPKIEKACPVYITANCFFQFFILFIIEISLYKIKNEQLPKALFVQKDIILQGDLQKRGYTHVNMSLSN